MEQSEPTKPRGGCLLPVLFFLSVVVIAIAALALLLGWPALVVVLAVGTFGGLLLHYLVWGWWLSPWIGAKVEEDDRRAAESER